MRHVLLAALAAFSPLAPAHAQDCAPRAAVLGILATNHGEGLRAIGVAANNMVMEVFANRETGTWTILVTTATGVTCMITSGHNYDEVEGRAQPGVPG